jgi:hypothetical protein
VSCSTSQRCTQITFARMLIDWLCPVLRYCLIMSQFLWFVVVFLCRGLLELMGFIADHSGELPITLCLLLVWLLGCICLWENEINSEKVHFWPSNYCLSLILTIKLQNWVSSTIQLLKPFTIGHRAVFMSGFNFFIYNLDLRY